jgi:hypothetical protein
MREIEINLTLRFKIPESDFNVNGLLTGLKKSSSDIMLGISKVLFMAIENESVQELLSNDFNGRYSLNGRQKARTLKTSFGDLSYSFFQIKDKQFNRTIVPLRDKLKIPKYKRYLDEMMEPSIGLAVHLSYGRAAKEIGRILDQTSSRWTVWRRLHHFSDQCCGFGDLTKAPYRFLMPDGTKVLLQGSGGENLGQKELRWAAASTGIGQPFDIVGVWVNQSWEAIANDLKRRLNYDKIEVLISDGAPGIENLLTDGMRHQRCIFHGKRDFPYILYQDGLKKKDQTPFRDMLESIPAMTISKTSLEQLTEKDKNKVKEICERTESNFKELIGMIDPEKYPKARIYIQNLSNTVSTFFHWWLKTGDWIPFTSNIIENRFSQVKNRIKRIGRRWSDAGLMKWIMVAIKKIFSPCDWESYWHEFLNLNRPMILTFMKVEYQWIN